MPYQFKTIAPCSVITGPSKKSLSIFVISPLYMLKGCSEVSLLFSRLFWIILQNNLSSLKLSLHKMCSSPLIIKERGLVSSKAGQKFRAEAWLTPTIRHGKGKPGRGRWKQMQRLPVSFLLLQLAFIRNVSIPTQIYEKSQNCGIVQVVKDLGDHSLQLLTQHYQVP